MLSATADGAPAPDDDVADELARLGLRRVHSGKVRDLWARTDTDGHGDLLVVASDRISAYDAVLPTPIPDKGRVLTALSLWWFERLADLVPTHLVAADGPRIPAAVRGRAMLVRRLRMYPVECVARGYLAGSGYAEYAATGRLLDVPLPPGLVEGSRLPEPVYTPTTKAAVGTHDEPMSYADTVAAVGMPAAAELRRLTLAVYARAAALAAQRGILVADTKLEFGYLDQPGGSAQPAEVVLADEVLTPDSSRFWPAEQWRPGGAQPSYDKQFVRDWLTSPAAGWDRASGAPPPPLPDEVVQRTRERYVAAYEQITGRQFS